MRSWLIHVLGGYTEDECEFLRMQLRGNTTLLEAILELGARLGQETTAPEALSRQEGKQPVPTVSEPWTIRKRRLEMEDLRRSREASVSNQATEAQVHVNGRGYESQRS